MKKLIALTLTLCMALCFCGCGGKKETGEKQNVAKTLSVYCLAGPTGVGAVNLMAENDSNYNFSVAAAPDQITAQIISGKADIAVIPTNLAAALYSKTKGKIKILAVNTLSVLSLIDTTGEVKSIADLKGREVYLTGKGSNPEYIFNYLLKNNGINPENDITLHFTADNQELAAYCATGKAKICVAPEPIASVIKTKVKVTSTINLEDEWEKLNNDSKIMMGCVVAQAKLIENNKSDIDKFLTAYEKSINKAEKNIDKTASLCEEKGIISPLAVAKAAIPNCGLTFISGSEMKNRLTKYLNVLYSADKASVGGNMPNEDFFYEK